MNSVSRNFSLFMVVYVLVTTFLLYVVEHFASPSYGVQMLQKILTFVGIPLVLMCVLKKPIMHIGKWSAEVWKYGVVFGLFSVIVITCAYIMFGSEIQWESMRELIEQKGVTEKTFLFIFLYITFGNSLIEELFFRSVLFRHLSVFSIPVAYIGSALVFSLYHFALFSGWFSGYILLLVLAGLFGGGIFFSWLYQKTGGIWSAYIFHIFADVTILLIGYREIFMGV